MRSRFLLANSVTSVLMLIGLSVASVAGSGNAFATTIGFDQVPGFNLSPFDRSYVESGFAVTPTSDRWVV
jgi:hypothetical protein